MNPLQILELVLLAMEKGPDIVKAVRNSFANDEEPDIEQIIAKLQAMAPPFDPDDED